MFSPILIFIAFFLVHLAEAEPRRRSAAFAVCIGFGQDKGEVLQTEPEKRRLKQPGRTNEQKTTADPILCLMGDDRNLKFSA